MITIVARGAVSPLGTGRDATRIGETAPMLAERDADGFVARAKLPALFGERDRATVLLEYALSECARELDQAWPEWRGLRVGAAIGTSSGGMRSFTTEGAAPTSRLYIGPVIDAARPVTFDPFTLVLGACASSTLAIGIGMAWLAEERCDLVLCGGFDAVSRFVAAGFECLRATCSAKGPQPFREGRDGLALGEGAAIVALARRPSARHSISGFGASCDAKHLTAPAPDGEGLARAAAQARGGARVDLVSAHGTATTQNDASEAKAIANVAPEAGVFSLKGTIGHTLGAAGALELLALVEAMEEGIVPATHGEGPAIVPVRDRAARLTPSRVDTDARPGAEPATFGLKLSSAFGGVNAALAVARGSVPPGERKAPREAYLSRAVLATAYDVEALAAQTGYARDRIARGDDLVKLSMAAVAQLGDVRGAGIVVGHGLATVETNALFQARIARPEPRRFPYTTPNAAAGECAVAFGLTGPAFAVGGGPHGGIEAIGVASSLVRLGLCDRIVVVAVDAVGPESERLAPGGSSGAVALLVSAAPPPEGARIASWSVRLSDKPIDPSAEKGTLPCMDAHRALLPLVEGRPIAISAKLPWGNSEDGLAQTALVWL